MRRTIGRFGILLAGVLAAQARPAAADVAFRPRVAAVRQDIHGKTFGALTVNDETAVVLRTAAGGLGGAERAEAAAARLNALVAGGLAAGTITVRRAEDRAWAVTAGGQTLLLVTRAEAAAHDDTAEGLARSWAGALRRLIAEPPLAPSATRLVVPLGEARVVTVAGAAPASSVGVADGDPRVTKSEWDAGHRTLTVRGLAPGQTTVQVTAGTPGQAAAPVAVSVMKYAARVSPAVTVAVTGVPFAPPDVVAQAASSGLSRAVDAEAGADWHPVGDAPFSFVRLYQGHQTVLRVPVRATGDNLLPVEATTALTVVNQPIALQPAGVLFYSNNPEQVKDAQTLFWARIPPTPVRLDYHHQNSSGGTLVFHADLVDDTDAPASAQVTAGVAAPGSDTVQVGRRAGAAFLTAQNAQVGVVLAVPPHSRVPMVTQRLANGLTASGLMQIQQTDGAAGALAIRVAADGDGEALASPLSRVMLASVGTSAFASPALDLPRPAEGAARAPSFSPYIFASPLVRVQRGYAVGGQWAYIRLGHKDALRDASGKRQLFGNYGATYEITVTMTNPTSTPRPVLLVFAPEAGLAAGVFQVDGGPLLEYDPVAPPDERQIARYTLAPGEKRITQIRTIPLNGSAYPADVVVHAL